MQVNWLGTKTAGFSVKIIDYKDMSVKEVEFVGKIMNEDEYTVTVSWENPATLEDELLTLEKK